MTAQNQNIAEKKQALSMRAVREANNRVDVTLINVNATREGLTHHSAAQRLEKQGYNEVFRSCRC
jgi:Mg2+-importing ATPase